MMFLKMLTGWKGMAAGAGVAFALGFAMGAKTGEAFTKAELAPELAAANQTISNLRAEKATAAVTALQVLDQLARDARDAEAAAEETRQANDAARLAFAQERRTNVTQGQSQTCAVSESDAAAGRLLDSRLFDQPEQ
jgi:hypothetical protein